MTATTEITNLEDIIDSRDVIARIDYLSSDVDSLDDDERVELAALKSLADEASNIAADWEYGEALIRDSYFQTYAQELAKDCGLINAEATWPNYCIDGERAARDLRMDYSCADFDGVTYWTR